jgi:hypothetical protein
MNVRELRELLNEIPEGFTKDEFDELEVQFSVDGFNFETPCDCECGVIEFEGLEDESGDILDEYGNPETLIMFALMPHNISEIMEQTLSEPDINLN